MYNYLGYRVVFSETLPTDMELLNTVDNTIYVPETHVYKFIFMNNQVNDVTVSLAIAHAIRKVNQFIDSL